MNNQVLTILNKIQKDVAQIKEKIEDLEPVYGSDAWWEREVLAGEKEIKAGNYKTYKDIKKLITDLHRGI